MKNTPEIDYVRAPNDQSRDDATWRFITWGWQKESPGASLPNTRFTKRHPRSIYYINKNGDTISSSDYEYICSIVSCSERVLTHIRLNEEKVINGFVVRREKIKKGDNL